MKFEIGKYYRHSGIGVIHIIGHTRTHFHGDALIAESDQGALLPVGEDEDSAVNWKEVPGWRKRHELKTDQKVYDVVANGLKTFEIRRDDRGFSVGDELLLRKTVWSGSEMANGCPLEYTGDELVCRVSYILKGPIYGLQEGWVIMSIEPPLNIGPQESSDG